MAMPVPRPGRAKRRRRPHATIAAAGPGPLMPGVFRFSLLALLLLQLLLKPTGAFLFPSSLQAPLPQQVVARPRVAPVCHFDPRGGQEVEVEEKEEQQQAAASLPALASASPQYEELMEKLTDDEKYNILLQSRASSLIDVLGGRAGARRSGTGGGGGGAEAEFQPIYKLVEEMTGKGVKLTAKSFATLVDAASLSRSLVVIQDCLLLARRNGVCRAFSRDVGVLAMPPTSTGSSSSSAGGRAVEGLPAVPTDDRSLEVGAGLGALAVVGGALAVEAFGPLFQVDTTPASVVLLLATVAAALDFTQRQGKELQLVLSGLNRLFLRDPEREARVQAATFLAAYLLGLPCFCFSPNVLEAARMAAEVPEFRDSLSSTTGLTRLLVYLLAPVAAEEASHVQLVASDPRQARALVQVFRERNPEVEVDAEGLLLPWAFQEARRLLAANGALLEKLRKRMESGGATVGDCVSLLEGGTGGGGMGGIGGEP